MALTWVVIGSFLQLSFSSFLFMMATFAVGGVNNRGNLSKISSLILAASLYLLPLTSILAAGIVIYQYNHGGGASSYWWHFMPVAAAASYIIYINSLWGK
ncbi:hypothetical protein BTJ40_07955 [Microbulbifer sp. A4B17]|uniref:hypothetical protein n=1 Tax=Microbulbifer sp. A4B17 TaxID=359370 RepID=UPI000D52EBF8|nr:hypothetical protein [Microbulbifer sp. A4B17]AWF80747.1 hypothetical protein BTJ40_07955 [Microbulbifer sp. A4B17]